MSCASTTGFARHGRGFRLRGGAVYHIQAGRMQCRVWAASVGMAAGNSSSVMGATCSVSPEPLSTPPFKCPHHPLHHLSRMAHTQPVSPMARTNSAMQRGACSCCLIPQHRADTAATAQAVVPCCADSNLPRVADQHLGNQNTSLTKTVASWPYIDSLLNYLFWDANRIRAKHIF